ncbi:MAG: hypothetical protein ACOX9C_03340 [Kiritimatiellia bacterium]|jgi:REP element-mobilizing transposase RayT
MKLQFQRRGRQFFFFTVCVNKRRPLLSRLVDETTRPVPTEAGGKVLEMIQALHGLNPALTASDFVIMPDHVHFLLIVNYDADPGFNPLCFVHAFREETERMIATGGPPPRVLRNTPPPWSGGSGAQSPSVAPFWEPDFWIALSFDSRQLRAIRTYIRNNPARAIWKRKHPDRFIRHAGLRHRVLDPSLPWSGYGDLTLLASPFLFPVRLTRRLPVSEQEPLIADVVEKAERGMIPVSGFLSPAEKEVERRLRLSPRARWIKSVAHGLPPRFDPSLADSRRLAAGQELILSSFPADVPVFPVSRENCELMNARIIALCAAASARDGGTPPPNPLGVARDGGAPPPNPLG